MEREEGTVKGCIRQHEMSKRLQSEEGRGGRRGLLPIMNDELERRAFADG